VSTILFESVRIIPFRRIATTNPLLTIELSLIATIFAALTASTSYFANVRGKTDAADSVRDAPENGAPLLMRKPEKESSWFAETASIEDAAVNS
jgi:hypothetical protein